MSLGTIAYISRHVAYVPLEFLTSALYYSSDADHQDVLAKILEVFEEGKPGGIPKELLDIGVRSAIKTGRTEDAVKLARSGRTSVRDGSSYVCYLLTASGRHNGLALRVQLTTLSWLLAIMMVLRGCPRSAKLMIRVYHTPHNVYVRWWTPVSTPHAFVGSRLSPIPQDRLSTMPLSP